MDTCKEYLKCLKRYDENMTYPVLYINHPSLHAVFDRDQLLLVNNNDQVKNMEQIPLSNCRKLYNTCLKCNPGYM